MITKAITAFANSFMQPFKVIGNKCNPVLIVYLPVFNKALFILDTIPFSEIKQRGLP